MKTWFNFAKHAVAKIFPDRDNQNVRMFVKDKTGVIYDSRSRLEWYVNKADKVTWEASSLWVNRLNYDQFSDGRWRLPTLDELKTLYMKNFRAINTTALLEPHPVSVWSCEFQKDREDYVFVFNFRLGRKEYRIPDGRHMVFAVRDAHEKKVLTVMEICLDEGNIKKHETELLSVV